MGLLERDEQFVRLTELLEAARDGQGSVVLVRGEAGVGKTVRIARDSLLSVGAATSKSGGVNPKSA